MRYKLAANLEWLYGSACFFFYLSLRIISFMVNPQTAYFSFIVPCYNEASRFSFLREAFEDFDKVWQQPYELVIVDDGSVDATLEVVNQWANSDPLEYGTIVTVPLGKNQGKGRALQEGMKLSHGDWVLTLDADMATQPQQLISWIESGIVWEDNTVYIGSRVHADSEIEAKWIRKITGGIYNLVTRIFTPIREYDTQCGFKLYPSKLGKKVFDQLRTAGWAHDIEILSRAVKEGGRIQSLPVVWVHRDGAKIDVLSDGLKMFIETLKIGRMIKKEYKE